MATPMKSGTRSSEKSAAPSAKTKKKKEEEERKKREEEDARIKAETADKERAENEKRIAQEKTSLAKEINELRRRELTEFYEFIKPRRQEAHEIKIKQREAFKWKRVLQCDGTPDPTVLPEINTYMSLWRDEQKNTAIENTMDQTNLVLSLINELNTVINSIPNGTQEVDRIPIYKQTIRELEDMLHAKWLQAAHDIMLKATDLQDLETNNFQYTAENQNVTLCVWANLSHNPRMKPFTFDKCNFTFELPKPLLLANVAIVGLFLKYDYYSERSLLSKCRTKAPEYEYDPIPEPLVEETPPDDDERKLTNENSFDANLPPELRKLMEQTKQREEAEAMLARDATSEQSAVVSEEEKLGNQRSTTELNSPKSVSNQDKLFNSTADQILEELADEAVVDLRSHWPLLPILKIDLYHIPPQPKKLQEWTIVQVDNSDILVQYPYPSDPMIAQSFYEDFVNSKNKSSDHSTKKDDDKNTKDPEDTFIDPSATLDATLIENNPEIRKMFLAAAAKNETPLIIKFKIPNNLFVTEKPLLGRWITEKKHWRQEGYVDYQYLPDTRMISFKTYDLGTYALLNDRHAHMPFQSWRMRPRGIDHVNFTLQTQTFEITFEIKYDKVAVFLPPRPVEPIVTEEKTTKTKTPQPPPSALSKTGSDVDEHPFKRDPAFYIVAEPIANKFMPLEQLIEQLKFLGLNVFPESDSDSYVSVINKNHKLEWWVYQQMAIVSCCTAFSYSHWNAFVNDEMKMVVGCKEHLQDSPPMDEDMRCIIFTSELVGFTDVSESSAEFIEASTFSDYHAESFHLTREQFSPEAHSRTMDTSPLFTETMNKLLMSIKPLTFA